MVQGLGGLDGANADHQNIKRLQKKYLVRTNEALEKIIPGSGIRPVSQIRRTQLEIKQQRLKLAEVTEEEFSQKSKASSNETQGNRLAQELTARRNEITRRLEELGQELMRLESL